MLIFVESSHLIGRKWNVGLILITTVLIQVTSASEPANTLNLRKCHCNKYQAWDGTTCHNIDTFLPIYNNVLDTQKDELNIQKHSTVILTSTVQNVTVKELKCPEDLFFATLSDNILLLPDGRLLWLLNSNVVFTNDIFCIEHIVEMGQIYFDAHICLPPPEVPRCCPENHVLDQDGSCHPRENLQAPPIQLRDHLVEWNRVGGYMETPRCNEHENLRQIYIRPGEGQLDDTQPKAMLEWDPKIWSPSPYWRDRYCVALQEMEKGDVQFVAQICWKDHERDHKHQCNNSLCIRKCCPDEALLIGRFCTEALSKEELWRPSQIPGQEINEEWKMVYGEPGCDLYSYFGGMHLLPNGSLQDSAESAPTPPSHYCLDNVLFDNGSITSVAMLCFPQKNIVCLWRDILIKVAAGLSCVFLVMTLAVYLSVAELRDHTYGRCLISMVTAMLTAYTCLLCGPGSTNSRASCYTLAFFKHLSVLAMFFWLNVMCFDMWKILRGSTVQHHSVKMFLGYSLYAWGCSILVSVVALVLDITAPQNINLPEYNDGACWFRGNAANWAYLNVFILVLVLVNVCFFIHVAMTLYSKMKQRTQDFQTNSSYTTKITGTKQQLWLFTKLFVVMGVVWIVELLSAVTHRKTCSYWVVTDVFNGLQGVFIFLVAVCSKSNLKKIKDAWQPRVHAVRKSLFNMTGQTSQRTAQDTLSIDDTDASRKTSITSLPRKFSQASNIFFPRSSKKTATLNPSDSPESCCSRRKGSNVSIKDVVPLNTMKETVTKYCNEKDKELQ